MQTRKKNTIHTVILLLLVFTMSILAACGTQAGTPSATTSVSASATTSASTEVSASTDDTAQATGLDISKREKMVIYRGGTPTTGEAAVIEALQAATADVINCDIDIVSTPWSDYNTKLTLMSATGDQMDAFSIWKGGEGTFVSKPGFVAPLNELIDKYGANLKKTISEEAFAYVTYGSDIISLPQMFPEKRTSLTIRMDILKAAGINAVPANFAELETALLAVKQKFPEQIISGAGDYKTVSFSRYLEPVTTSIRTGDFSYYFDKQKDSFDIYPNHPLYIQQRKIASEWYQKGLIDQDIIMRNSEQYSQLISSGKMVMFDSPWISEADAIRAAVPEAELEVLAWTIAGTKPAPYQNQILITEKSKIKDRVVTFFDWVWSDQANYNLVMYGIEGTHFNVVDGKISYPEGVTAATSEFPSPWDTVFQNNGMFLFNTAWDPIVENSLRALWDFQGYSVDEMAGFNPDLSMFNDVIPTQARYMDEYLQKTLLGALDVDTATKELYDNWLKTCRGEEQIEELTKQYKAWKAQ